MRAVYVEDLRFSVERSEELYNKGCELAKHEGQGPKRSMGNPRQGKKVAPKVAGRAKGRDASNVTSRLRDEDQLKDTRATKKPAAPSRPASPSESSSSSDEKSSSSSSSHSRPREAVTPPHRPQPPIRQPTAEKRKQEHEQERRETDI
ncbi:uncharacterized protein LOC132630758 [Lycium barbarum]|uniref:uncharacterized protein LOC132630758 n=1 Tax=Lycium barbarum TaxID=112863 RepID=UPI00293E80D8|nr:uncharacterized protein LOC132630758 [Lycium barbarum]